MAHRTPGQRQQSSICFSAQLVGGDARTSAESKRVEWADPNDVEALPMHPSMRMRLQHALDGRKTPYIG
jgi:hypothetical protein